MKEEQFKLSILFSQIFSKRFVMINSTELKDDLIAQDHNFDTQMQDFEVPIGIIDCAKVNQEYKELLTKLEIAELDNSNALEMIESKVKKLSRFNIYDETITDQGRQVEEEVKQPDDTLS